MNAPRDRDRLMVGEVRPSQMMYSYGIGSIIDLPNLSVIVMGLDEWHDSRTQVVEPRLLNAIRYYPNLNSVSEMRALPRSEAEPMHRPQFGSELVGAPVAVFPRWWVCPVCRQLAPLSSGIFEMGKTTYPPERIMFHHTGCTIARKPQAIPARILVACEDGHLDDFPWMEFLHRDESCKLDAPTLKLEEAGVSGEVRDLQVRCSCGKTRRLADAFGKENRGRMPQCTGRRPHLRDYDEVMCKKKMRPIALGASNLWFPIALTVLSIPLESEQAARLVETNWNLLRVVNDNPTVLNAFRDTGQFPRELAELSNEAILQAVRDYVQRQQEVTDAAPDIKLPEYRMLAANRPVSNDPEFQTRRLETSKGDWRELGIADVILVERLREVQAMVGFARLDAVGELTDPDQQVLVRAAPLSRRSPTWVPATELRGEGLFLCFDEQRVSDWEDRPEVRARADEFREAHTVWRKNRGIANPADHFPDMRYVLLHSFSHAFMRQLALEAGYAAASLKERIYARPKALEGGPMAGILIYTAAADSEGTLGGLLGIGENEEGLYYLVRESLRSMALCAGDPLCAEHEVDTGGRTVHGAACHACLFAPETSCERGNRYLDRTALVPTTDSKHAPNAFFAPLA